MPSIPLSNQATVVLSALTLPLLIWFAIQGTTNTQDLNNWIDKSSDEYARYQTFRDRFGTDDDVVVSWPDCTAENPMLEQLVARLQAKSDGRFERVVSGADALKRLRESASKFSDKAARRRLRGSLFGDDLKTSCAVIGLSKQGRDSLSDSIELIEETTTEVTGLPREKFHVVGKAPTSLALNRQTNQSLPLGIPGVLLAGLVACVAIGNTRVALAVLWTAGFGALLSLAAVTVVGIPVNGLLVLMPVLVFVLSLGGAIHMARAWQAAICDPEIQAGRNFEPQPQDSIARSLRTSRPPILISFVTTAIGFSTLCYSPLPAVFQFGVFTAVSLLAAVLLLLFLLPATWRVFKASPSFTNMDEKQPFVLSVLKGVARFPKIVLLLSFVVMAAGGYGLSRFEADLQVSRLFDGRTQAAIDTEWFEKNLFPSGRVELMFGFPRASQTNRFFQLQTVRGVQARLRKLEHHHAAMSVVNFVAVPKITGGVYGRNLVQQSIANLLDADTEQLSKEGMLGEDDKFQYWRVSVACSVDRDTDELANSELFLKEARLALGENKYHVQVEATGLGPVSASGQRRLFEDLVRGLLMAIAVITPLLMLTLRRFGLGLFAMLPNLFPLIVVFGYCGWIGKRMDIGATLTASVGLGIAIDDSLHFLHYERLRRGSASGEVEGGAEERNSVGLALQHCWAPVLTTTLIICVGLSPFLFSQFLPIKHFATCLSAFMLVAVIADLVLLPALLGGVRSKKARND